MQLSLTRSGGFTGVMKPPLVVSSDDLSDADQKRLKELVSRVSQTTAAAKPSSPPSMPDRFEYQLTIEDDEGSKSTLKLSEQAMAPAAAELVQFVQSAAQGQK